MNIDALRKNIDTVFIVMLENRSFDHALGARAGNVPALTNPSSYDGRAFKPTVHADAWINSDLPHSREQVATAMEGGMRGFVHAYEQELRAPSPDDSPPMWLCRPSDVPITTFLADNYCVCTRWHASLPCDTQPNRLMAMSGTTLIDTTDLNPIGGKWLPDQYTVLDWLTDMTEVTDRPGFAIYVDSGSIPIIGYPTNFFLMKRLHPVLTGRTFGLTALAQHMAAWDPDADNPDERPPAVVYCEPFYNDLATALPVVRLHGSCNHPPLPMAFGEAFLKKVYDTVTTANPRVWGRSALLVVYDEHGGFFDHVVPPPMHFAPPTGSAWTVKAPFETLGVRIPAIIVSPWTMPGGTCGALLNHTSILQLLADRFGSTSTLGRFGQAGARKNAGVSSVALALSATAQSGSPPLSPSAIPSMAQRGGQAAATMPPSGNSRLWGAHVS